MLLTRSLRFAPRSLVSTRLLSFTQADQPRVRIGSTAPNFQVDTTHGKIDFHEFIGNNWTILFSHPKDFTPICTTELGAFSRLKPEFDKRGVKLIGLSVEDVDSHKAWIKDIEDIEKQKFQFPIIADGKREVAFKYDMVTEEDFKNLESGLIATIRSVFIIDPLKKVRAMVIYPPSIGRNTSEILRTIDALQLADKKGVVTPVDWQLGDDVIIPPTVSDEAAKEKFGEFKKVKPYLRYTSSK
ncbi:unnamed protein product [Candida verbasci]|uniref:Thioredoxin domain-containing protein n=1 Tax=Candida verbasci TaxID=1227364 RepID=A0A9W4X7W4_9ASCO|nr:unnamed protein product [Candida verbasci]